MKIKIIQIGKNKDDYIEVYVNEFIKRLKPFVNLELLTLKEITATKSFPKNRCIDAEGKEILKLIEAESKSGSQCIIVMDEKGKDLTSLEFARFLGKNADHGQTMIFVIGGPYGLSEEVKKLVNTRGTASLLSLSKMTFTHQMIRIFLLEQIYRGVSIIHGKEYHHE